MKVFPFLNPLIHSMQQSLSSLSTKQEEWKNTFGHFFNSLKETFTRTVHLNKSGSVEAGIKEPVVKTNDIATKTLIEKTDSKPGTSVQTFSLNSELPLDTKGIIKKLDNGFTYYLRNHAYPCKQTAELRLVVRAGSTDEEQGQEGIAHFLEHLLFYETEFYEKKGEIKKFFESKGAAFGADQNAYTSFNRTVYKFNIPLTDPELLDKALHIFREMATNAKISESCVEEERAIVLDEIQNENAAERYMKKRDAILLAGTPYPNRKPAGLEKVIRECTADQIRAFYRHAYQPQNMALIAVGDFDPAQVENLVRKHFSNIPPSAEKALTHDFKPIINNETQFICHSDPESTSSAIQVYYPLKSFDENRKPTLECILQGMINKFYHLMFNKRLQEIVTDSDSAPFSLATGNKAELMDNIFYYRLTIVANDGEIPEAYRRVLLELKRVQEHGFLNEEFELTKNTYLSLLEHTEKEKDEISTEEFVNAYISHFTDEEPIVDVEKTLKIKKALLKFIQLDHINSWCNIMVSNPCTLVSVLAPSTSDNTVSPEVLKKIKLEVSAEKTSPYANTFSPRPLLRNAPQEGKIVNTTFYEKTGITQWILENGMRVFVKPSILQADTIKIYCSKAGGLLSAPLEKRAAVEMSTDVFVGSGRAGLTPSQLKKVMNGKTVGQNFIMGNYLTTLFTVASKKDIESAFQLIHTSFTDQTYNEKIFNKYKKENINAVKHQNNNPEFLFHQLGVDLCTQNHPIFQSISKEEYEKAEFEDCINFLNNQFQNGSNFDLVILGNLDLDETKKMVEKYLAGIPGQGRSPMDLAQLPRYEYPAGIVTKEIEAGIASDCKTHISFPAPAEDDFKSRELGSWTAQLLTIHLYDLLTFGGKKSYTVNCDYVLSKLPGLETIDPSSMELEFSSLPENIHEVNQIVLNELKKLQIEGFTKEEVDSYKAQLKEQFRKCLDDDVSLMTMIVNNVHWNFDLNNMLDNYTQLIESFDEQIATEKLRKLFPLNRYVQTTLLPAKK